MLRRFLDALLREWSPRVNCMGRDGPVIYATAASDIILVIILLVLGVLIIGTYFKREGATSINLPLGCLFVTLALVFAVSCYSLWVGQYWLVVFFKVLCWGCGVWTICILPKAIMERRAYNRAIKVMKEQLAAFEKTRNDNCSDRI